MADEPTRRADFGERVLVVAGGTRDAQLTAQLLEQRGLRAKACDGGKELWREVEWGAGVAILGDETLDREMTAYLRRALRHQPYWSDLPLIVLTREGAVMERAIESLGPAGNVTVLERPVRVATLMSAVQTALRARRRQYEVRDLVTELRLADRRKDEFLAMLGHELRNPLGTIRNALELLRHPHQTDDERRSARGMIERQVGNLVRMVADLLDVARITKGKIALDVQRVELNALVEHALRSFTAAREETADRPIQLVKSGAPVLIDADPVRIEQVVHNLLHNAVKYTAPRERIEIAVIVKPEWVQIRVRDEGIGIEPRQLREIFEPFVQAEGTLARSKGGLGLGLPLVRSLLELHGGRVTAHSEGPGRGSEFIAHLPGPALGSLPVGVPVETDAAPAPAGRPLPLLLVVEDQRDSREALRELLQLWGYPVETAADGTQAIEQALSMRPAVALVDIGLPGVDGYEVARTLRSRLGGTMLLIAMTGYGLAEDRKRALDAGFDRHLVKPVDPRKLSRLLHDFTNGSAPDAQA